MAIDCACGYLKPAGLKPSVVFSGNRAYHRYGVAILGSGTVILDYDGSGTWSSDTFSLVCNSSSTLTVYLSMTAVGVGRKDLVLSMIDSASSQVVASWRNNVTGFTSMGGTPLWLTTAIKCLNYDPLCKVCISPIITSNCECGGVKWVPEVTCVTDITCGVGTDTAIPAGTVALLGAAKLLAGSTQLCTWSSDSRGIGNFLNGDPPLPADDGHRMLVTVVRLTSPTRFSVAIYRQCGTSWVVVGSSPFINGSAWCEVTPNPVTASSVRGSVSVTFLDSSSL